ncbi:MAG TPA: GNAT family N-acetyltransferase [Actinocrinis sp.]|nr:GNAT family N-acetyltransferase [Actinocrinis sp.]
MKWTITEDFDEYVATVGPFLACEPVLDTLIVTLVDMMRIQGPAVVNRVKPLMGWWHDDAGEVAATLFQTPPFPVVLSRCPVAAVEDLAEVFVKYADRVTAVTVAADHEEIFRKAMATRYGTVLALEEHQRLYRLGRLAPPVPTPPGRAHVAGQEERELIVKWIEAFVEESLAKSRPDAGVLVDARLPWGGMYLWRLEDGTPVSVAGRSREAVGMTRIGPVYTLPEYRGNGYAAGLTAAISQAALDAGIGEVLLFTDMANPTSNGVYQRIGYEAVTDRMILSR